jgi:hypothetical protein
MTCRAVRRGAGWLYQSTSRVSIDGEPARREQARRAGSIARIFRQRGVAFELPAGGDTSPAFGGAKRPPTIARNSATLT